MPIDFECKCGRKFRSRDDGAGRTFDCPRCGDQVTVPVPDPTLTGPAPSSPAPHVMTSPEVMNSVGLFALLLAFSSYLAIFACLVVAALAGYWAVPNVSAFFKFLGSPLSILCLSVPLVLSGLGSLVCRMGHQRIVRPFCSWGLGISGALLAISCLSFGNFWLESRSAGRRPRIAAEDRPLPPLPPRPRLEFRPDPELAARIAEAQRLDAERRREAEEAEERSRRTREARLELERIRAERARMDAEKAEADRLAFEEKVATVYPVARKALIDARNRGNAAHVSTRKAAVAREQDKARDRLCRDYQIGHGELEMIIAAGEERDGTAARRQASAGKADAKARANVANQQMLGALGKQLDRAAGRMGGPGGPPALPAPVTAPIR